MPWSSLGNEALWVQAYRHVHDVFRAVSPGFQFDWNGDSGYLQSQTAAYPGDATSTSIGLDVYDKGMGGTDRLELVDQVVERPDRGVGEDPPEPRSGSATSRSRTASRSAIPNGHSTA